MTPKRRVVAVGALLFAAFAVYRVFFVYTVRTGRCAAPEPPTAVLVSPERFPPELVVMTWNIEGHAALLDGDHVEKIAAVIRAHRPDVVGLQEVHRNTVQSRFRDQASDLARLTGMAVHFGPSFKLGDGGYGNAVLTGGRVVQAVVHPLPSVGEPRSLLELRIDISGGTIAVFVTHLVTWGRLTRAVRSEQLACITAHVSSTSIPWILVGDLNAPPRAAEIERLRDELPATGVGPDAPTHRLTARQLDYVISGPGWRFLAARVVDEGPSDHRAVVARLEAPA